MSLIIENSNRHEHNGNGIAIDQIVSNLLSIVFLSLKTYKHFCDLKFWGGFINNNIRIY